MLVCNVALRAKRTAISADVAEAVTAVDAPSTLSAVLTVLVDEPASANDIAIEYIGDDVNEAVIATDSFDADLPVSYDVDIAESAAAAAIEDAVTTSGVTWNPSDKNINVTLSNGNLTAQGTSAGGSYGVRATSSRSTGKYYFEVKPTGTVQNAGPALALSTVNVSNMATIVGEALLNLANGSVFINSTSLAGTTVSYAVNDICCVAVDLDNKKIWFRKNGGLWNNNAAHDPATNTGGFSISSVATGPLYPAVHFSATTLVLITANFGATAFAQTMPSGFSAWQ